ncbi:MAG: hypothetical protein HFI03_16760 [Lachnospiraceae bacterium]|nr:hypothetical protein [Lachnospiraceae bacterium]
MEQQSTRPDIASNWNSKAQDRMLPAIEKRVFHALTVVSRDDMIIS